MAVLRDIAIVILAAEAFVVLLLVLVLVYRMQRWISGVVSGAGDNLASLRRRVLPTLDNVQRRAWRVGEQFAEINAAGTGLNVAIRSLRRR